MKIKSLLLCTLALCLMFGLCACGGDTPADNTTATTTQAGGNSTTATTTTTTQATTTTTTVADGKVTYTVTVTDEGGTPIPGAAVQLCLNVCVAQVTNAQGVATYLNLDEGDHKVSFINIPEGYSVDENEFHFDEGSYEMTIVLKAVA